MYTVILTSIIAVLLTYFSGRGEIRKNDLYKFAFILLTFLACIQYNYGNDYPNYFYSYLNDYHTLNFWKYFERGDFRDPGWVLFNHIFPKPYGFFVMVAVTAIITNYIYYYFIKENVERKWRWIAVFLYVFSTSFYLLNFSMIRQGFVVSLCIIAGIYIGKRKWIPAFLIILFSISIHKSAIIFLPCVLLCFFKFNNGRVLGAVILGVTTLLFLLKDLLITSSYVLAAFDNEQMSYYTSAYVGQEQTMSLGVGFLLGLIPHIISLYFLVFRLHEFTYSQKIFIILGCITVLFIPLQMTISGYIGRLSYYFMPYHIVTYPILYQKLKGYKHINKSIIKFSVATLFLITLFYDYYAFFFDNWSSVCYSKEFKTILSY